jgi:hypothetical protein
MAIDRGLRAELLARCEHDQRVRAPSHDDAEEMDRVDQDNSTWLEAVVRERGWPGRSLVGRDGALAAFLFAQHSPDRELQQWFLERVRVAVEQNEAERADLALLEDRVRMFQGRPQLYGSQFVQIGDELTLHPVEDPAGLDERRAAMGLMPFAEYEQRLRARNTPAPNAPAPKPAREPK